MADYNDIYRAYREFKAIADEVLDDIFGEGYDNAEDCDERDRRLQERFDERLNGRIKSWHSGSIWDNGLADVVAFIALNEYGHEFEV